MKPAGREGGHGGVGPDIVPVIFWGYPRSVSWEKFIGQRAPSSEARSAHTNGRRSGLQSREPSAPPQSAGDMPGVFGSANTGASWRARSVASAGYAGANRSARGQGGCRGSWPPAMQPWSAPRSFRAHAPRRRREYAGSAAWHADYHRRQTRRGNLSALRLRERRSSLAMTSRALRLREKAQHTAA